MNALPPTPQPDDPTPAASPDGQLAAFDPATMRRQLVVDAAIRWGLLAGLIGAIVLGPQIEPAGLRSVLLVVLAGGWVWMMLAGARGGQALTHVTLLLDDDLAQAQAALAQALTRRALPRTVRLLLYHRLAVLRHRQGRVHETAAICQALLAEPLGGADRAAGSNWLDRAAGGSGAAIDPVRAHLLLMLADCRLSTADLWGAQQALVQLHQGRLGLMEYLHRLALQTRYEIAAGYGRLSLANLPAKLRLAELLPASQCAALHALWARAAQQAGTGELARWLDERAALLGATKRSGG